MGIIIEARIQCDVCGNSLNEQYPPMFIAASIDEIDEESIESLKATSLADMKARAWGHNPKSTRYDRWGYRTVIRCHECRHERRWE